MSQRLKITLSDAVMAELKRRAERAGEPVARIAAQMLCQAAEHNPNAGRAAAAATPAVIEDDDLDVDRHAPWIEPVMGDPAWRRRMWGSIVALHGRYPHAFAHLKDGWWEDSSPCRDAVRSRGVARLDRRRCRRSALRAGVPGATRRLRTRAPAGRRQCHQRLAAGCSAWRVGMLTAT
jgi:hypothetical protein